MLTNYKVNVFSLTSEICFWRTYMATCRKICDLNTITCEWQQWQSKRCCLWCSWVMLNDLKRTFCGLWLNGLVNRSFRYLDFPNWWFHAHRQTYKMIVLPLLRMHAQGNKVRSYSYTTVVKIFSAEILLDTNHQQIYGTNMVYGQSFHAD